MAQLLVRNLDEELVHELKLRAARNGRSAEAEHRAILREVLARPEPPMSFLEALKSMPDSGDEDDALFERVQDYGRDVEL